MNNEKKNRKNGGWKKKLLIALCVILLLILLLIALATVYVNYLLNRMGRVDPENEHTLSSSQAEDILMGDPDTETISPDSTEDYVKIDDITFPTEATQPEQDATSGATQGTQPTVPTEPEVNYDHIVNILLVGQDRREGESRQRSDSMILVTFNKSTGDITLTSFMRDSYVQIPGYQPQKLNAAYAYGGMSLLSKTLNLNFGVNVDGVVEVDFSGFKKVIDLLGGVDITLTQAEADCLGGGLTAGLNHLTGEQALTYSRIRYIDSDYRRAERQRKVITALIDAYKSKPLTEILQLMDDLLPLVTTNLSNSQIISYAADLFPMLSGAQINTLRIPADGTFSQGNVEVRPGYINWFQYNIDFAANKKLLQEIFAPAE